MSESIPAQVVIAVPHLGEIPGYWMDSFLRLQRPPGSRLSRAGGMPIDIARNKLVRDFLDTPGATHIFFMDSDMTFPPETLIRLLQRGVDIVSGLYFARGRHTLPHVYRYTRRDETGQDWYAHAADSVSEWMRRHPEHVQYKDEWAFDYPDEPLLPVDGVGGGCLLISRKAILDIQQKYGEEWFKNSPGSRGGEDFDFCRKAQDCGFTIYADLNVHCAHEVRPVFTGRQDFADIYHVGEEDEHDWNLPIVVQVTPNGAAEVKPTSFRFPYGVEGYLTPDEGLILYRLAEVAPEGTVVVEQGTYKGRSTICMAQAGKPVIAIDHFKGEQLSGSMRSGQWDDHTDGAYRDALEANLSQYLNGSRDSVTVVEGETSVVPQPWADAKVGLLFVDADHTYEATIANFRAFEPHIAPGGYVAFHDTLHDGVKRAVDELIEEGWQTAIIEHNLTALKKETANV